MEDVLDVYHRPHDPKRPVVGLDEKPVQLVADVREPLPPAPGVPRRQDHEYKRNGTANVFCAFDPLGNWRRLAVTDRRTRVDWAHFVKGASDTRRSWRRLVRPSNASATASAPASTGGSPPPTRASN